MNLETILQRLDSGAYRVEKESDLGQEIHGVRFLTQKMNGIEEDILYSGDLSLLPDRLEENEFLNFLGTGDCPLKPFYLETKQANIVRFLPEADANEQYNRVQEYFIEDQKLTGMIRRILSAQFSNRGLQYLIDEASEVMGNPIFVVDNNYKYIAKAMTTPDINDNSKFAGVFREEMGEQQILENGLDYISKARLDEQSGNKIKPVYHYNEMLEIGTMVGAVRIHNIVVGHVMIIEKNHSFTHLDEEIFLRLQHFVAQELQKIPVYHKNKGQVISYFLIDLINDLQPNQHSVERQLKMLHFKPLEKFYMAVVKTESIELSPKDAEALTEQLRGILIGNIYAAYQDTFMILFNREKESGLGEYTRETLRKYAKINRMKVGISNEFSDITDTRKYFNQAVKAVEYGSIVHKERVLFNYEEFSYMEMLDICRHQANLLSFCAPSVLNLMRFDEQNGTEFMKTLYKYLEYDGNTTSTSKALYIHKNTLLYRMDKIRQMLDNDLSSGETMFMLHLSFRILIQMNLFDPQEQPEDLES